MGSHSITAIYSGDPDFLPSTSATLTQTVNQDPTTTNLGSSANPSVSGQSVTYTASVTANAPGSGTPTGTVTFQDGGVNIAACINQALVAGTATCGVSYPSAGSHSISAVYSGEPNFLASTSATLTQTVDQDPTTTALSSSGQPIGVRPKRHLHRRSHGQPSRGGDADRDRDLPERWGEHRRLHQPGPGRRYGNLRSDLPGRGGATASPPSTAVTPTSWPAPRRPLTQTVGQDATTTAVSSSANPSVSGQSVTYTATVMANAPGSGTPTGTVTFQDGGVDIAGCVNQAVVGGTATCGVTYPGVGSHRITAIYNGDPDFLSSVSALLTQTVNQDATTTLWSSSANPSLSGQGVTFTATVTANAPGSGDTDGDGRPSAMPA